MLFSQALLLVITCILRLFLINLHQNEKKYDVGGYLSSILGIKGQRITN